MTYKQTLDYICQKLPMYQRIGAAAYKADIKNTVLLCDAAGHPYKSFPSIHIAGTNGKGSVSHLTASILQAHELKTGLYTSPHLKDFRERIRLNGRMVTKSFVISFIEKYKREIELIKPSFFEITFVMAMVYFKEEAVDIAVIETGMGGRLDSTNIITPVLSVITNIGLDHTQFLGNTLQAIATEKAGIIKQKVPVIVGESNDKTNFVFTNKSAGCDSSLVFADKQFRLEMLYENAREGILKFNVVKEGKVYIENLISPLAGDYQKRNLVTLACIIDVLREMNYCISDEEIRKGVKTVKKTTGFAGRWEIAGRNPLIILDTCHNEEGIRLMIKQLNAVCLNQLHIVLGMVNDKDVSNILNLFPREASYYFCKADIPRAMDVEVLASKAYEAGLKGNVFTSVREAFETAKARALSCDVVFVGGSIFVVAEVV